MPGGPVQSTAHLYSQRVAPVAAATSMVLAVLMVSSLWVWLPVALVGQPGLLPEETMAAEAEAEAALVLADPVGPAAVLVVTALLLERAATPEAQAEMVQPIQEPAAAAAVAAVMAAPAAGAAAMAARVEAGRCY
jgi:hypothetical protein